MIYILLPSFNEEKALPKLCASISTFFANYPEPYKVIVVDDGSSDRTRSVALGQAQHMPIVTLSHPRNLGVARAMKTGILYVTEHGHSDDVMVNMDADNSHNPEFIAAMQERLNQGFDVVIASRYREGSKEVGLSWFRRLCSFGVCQMLRPFFPIRGVKDYSCGYRMFRVSILKGMVAAYGDHFITEQGFVSYTEILLKCAMVKARCTEVPLVLRYDLKEGASKMKVFKTIRRYLVLIANGKRALKKNFNQEVLEKVAS
jgi:dolichol-phosphate mannosyltransferase